MIGHERAEQLIGFWRAGYTAPEIAKFMRLTECSVYRSVAELRARGAVLAQRKPVSCAGSVEWTRVRVRWVLDESASFRGLARELRVAPNTVGYYLGPATPHPRAQAREMMRGAL